MMSSQEGGINPRVTLVGGVFAVASMIVWVTTTVGGACLYTVLPVRPPACSLASRTLSGGSGCQHGVLSVVHVRE